MKYCSVVNRLPRCEHLGSLLSTGQYFMFSLIYLVTINDNMENKDNQLFYFAGLETGKYQTDIFISCIIIREHSSIKSVHLGMGGL